MSTKPLVRLLGRGDEELAWTNTLRLEVFAAAMMLLMLVLIIGVAAYYRVLVWHDAGFIIALGMLIGELERKRRHLKGR